jgi:hypothetical protein
MTNFFASVDARFLHPKFVVLDHVFGANVELWGLSLLVCFAEGYSDGKKLRNFKEYDNVKGQAYDRGYEVGMHEHRTAQRQAAEELARLERQWEWAADGNVGLD